MTQILIVDDEPCVRDVLIRFLETHGFRAAAAEDGIKAVELLPSVKPQVVLLDVAMPGLDGIQTLQKIREAMPHCAVIMMSGHADHETALKALDLGAYDFIQKPFDFKYLEQTLITKITTLDTRGEAPMQGDQ